MTATWCCFCATLCGQCAAVQPGACPQTDALLYALRQPRPELLFATISNELAQLPSDLVLVLDDYSAVRSHAVNEFIAGLLRNWPQPLHLVLITRFDPPLALPALRGKVLSSRYAVAICASRRPKPAQYLNLALLSPPDDKTITAVQERAEGWIAGIKLAMLSLEHWHQPSENWWPPWRAATSM